jgi:hypothetical protein
VIDLVHKIQKIIWLHAVLGHQPTHRGAVALVVVLLQPEGLVTSDLQEVCDVVADALVDLLPQIDVMRVKRVVDIEDPGLDVAEYPRRDASVALIMFLSGRL